MSARGLLWFCTIPFWLLLAGAVVVAITEDPAPIRFVATVAGGAAMSAALIGLVLFVRRSTARAGGRTGADAVQAQIRAWAWIAGIAGLVAVGAAVAAATGQGTGAWVLAGAAAASSLGALLAIWRRSTGRASR